MSDIATRLRQCAADIRRTPVRLDTWIPLQQEAADTIDALRAEVDAFREDAANYYRIAKEADAQQAALRARVAELEKGSDFAADALRVVERRRDELKAERNDFRAKLGAITVWLEANQPDVFRRGLWDAIRCASNKEGSRE